MLRRALVLPCLLVAVISLLPQPAAASTTNVFGSVFDSNGRLVLNTTVAVQLVDATSGAAVASTTTDPSNASYSFVLAGGGRFNFTATPPAGSGLQAQTRNGVVVADGGTVEVDFHLPPLGSVRVSGHVLDQLGGGLGGQEVEFINGAGQAFFPPTPTDPTGAYTVELPVDSYRWEMHNALTSELRAPESYDLQTSALVPFNSDTTLDLRLPTVHLQVTVLDPGGRPVPGTEIFTDQSQTLALTLGGQVAAGFDWYQPPSLRPVGQAYYPLTNGSGVADLWLFPNAHEHVLTAVPPAASGLATTSWSVSVRADGSTTEQLSGALGLSGRVLSPGGAAVPGQLVTLSLTQPGAPVLGAASDGGGAYSFPSLNAGSYQLGLRASNTSASVPAPETYSLTSSAPLSVASSTSLDLVLPETPLRVTVTNGLNGATLAGAGLTTSLTAGSCPEPTVLSSCFVVGGLLGSGNSSYPDPGYAATGVGGASVLWLFPGTYRIDATPPAGSNLPPAYGVVTVRAGDASDVLSIVLGPPPTVTPSVSPAAPDGRNGWYVSAPVVSWTVSGNGLPLISTSGCGSVTLAAQGVSKLTCTATSASGTVSASATVSVDTVAPVVAWTGLAPGGVYTVDQTVALSCSASDATSGVLSSACGSVNGAAWSFGAGDHAVVGTASDLAGNAGSASATFHVVVTGDGMCALVEQWVTNHGIANSLCVKARHGQWTAFANEVRALSGKALTAQRAQVLVGLAAVEAG